jgi:hypothetical protein
MKQTTSNSSNPPLSDTDLRELESLTHRVDDISTDICEIIVDLQKIVAHLSGKIFENSLGLPNHTDPN